MNSLPENNESLKGCVDFHTVLLDSLYLDPYCDERLSMLKRFIYEDSFIQDFGIGGALYLVDAGMDGLDMHFPWLLDDLQMQQVYELLFDSLIGQKLVNYISLYKRDCFYLRSLSIEFPHTFFSPLWKGATCMGAVVLFAESKSISITKEWIERFCSQAESFF